MKTAISITLNSQLLSKVCELAQYSNRSHVIEKAVRKALAVKRFRECLCL